MGETMKTIAVLFLATLAVGCGDGTSEKGITAPEPIDEEKSANVEPSPVVSSNTAVKVAEVPMVKATAVPTPAITPTTAAALPIATPTNPPAPALADFSQVCTVAYDGKPDPLLPHYVITGGFQDNCYVNFNKNGYYCYQHPITVTYSTPEGNPTPITRNWDGAGIIGTPSVLPFTRSGDSTFATWAFSLGNGNEVRVPGPVPTCSRDAVAPFPRVP